MSLLAGSIPGVSNDRATIMSLLYSNGLPLILEFMLCIMTKEIKWFNQTCIGAVFIYKEKEKKRPIWYDGIAFELPRLPSKA
jgi:hypothetical protein